MKKQKKHHTKQHCVLVTKAYLWAEEAYVNVKEMSGNTICTDSGRDVLLLLPCKNLVN